MEHDQPASQPSHDDPASDAPTIDDGVDHRSLHAAVRARVVQPKLTVGPAGDRFEREADETADRIVAALRHGPMVLDPPDDDGRVQRAATNGGPPTQPLDPTVNRIRPNDATVTAAGDLTADAAAGRIHRAAHVGAAGGAVEPTTERAVQRAKGTGRPLDDSTRGRMESAFGGVDFSPVRIHTGDHADSLNEQISARAFTHGPDVFLHSSSANDEHTLAHELTHTIQQGAVGAGRTAHRRVDSRMQRKDGDTPQVKVHKKSDHMNTLDAIVSTFVPSQIAKGKATVTKYIARGLGAGGVSKLRSDAVKEFRNKMKTAARAQILEDINELLESDGIYEDTDVIKSDATMNFLSDQAAAKAYKPAKKSVDALMTDVAEKWVNQHYDVDAVIAVASESGRTAAWDVLKADPGKKSLQKSAQKAGRAAALRTVKFHTNGYLTQARGFKNSIVKPDAKAVKDQNQGDMASMVKEKASEDAVGEKTLTKTIKAFDSGGALTILGKLLDQVIPMPGETVALNITFQIPTGTPADVVFKLDGKAGRGIDGFSTTGVTSLGDPKRLEIYASLQVGAGFKVFGADADATVGVFIRGGSNKSTGAALSALNYAAYRGLCGINQKLGNFWGLGGTGSEKAADVRAEMWAAAIESNIFADEDDGSFGDVGGMAGVSAEGKMKIAGTGVEAAGSLTGEASNRFDTASLKESLGDDFAKTPTTSTGAAKRRKAATGRKHFSIALATSASADINGQGVSFAAAFSGEGAKGDGNSFGSNWGIQITAGISMQNGTALDILASGIIAGSVGCLQSVISVLKKRGKNAIGIVGDLGGDILRLQDAVMKNAISEALGNVKKIGGEDMIGVSSSLTATLNIGRSGGKLVMRIDITDEKKMEVGFGVGSVTASKTRRIASAGYEDGALLAEVGGLRTPKLKVKN